MKSVKSVVQEKRTEEEKAVAEDERDGQYRSHIQTA
ncbi:hypothetical protein J3R74_000874 [Puniceicoccus vermicola]